MAPNQQADQDANSSKLCMNVIEMHQRSIKQKSSMSSSHRRLSSQACDPTAHGSRSRQSEEPRLRPADLFGGGPRGAHRPLGGRGSHLWETPQSDPARADLGHGAARPSDARPDRPSTPPRGQSGDDRPAAGADPWYRGRRRKRKPTTQVQPGDPVRTFADWNEPAPGSWRWTSSPTAATRCRGRSCGAWWRPTCVRDGPKRSLWWPGSSPWSSKGSKSSDVSCRYRSCGIDSDNDSAFINETLQGYCQEQQIEFTRSRPYQKNDQAWIEQKNGSVIRRFVGYRRFSGLIAGQCLARLYEMVRLYVNYFQPSFKLRSKTREGAKVKKQYHKPATPCERLLAHASVSTAAKEALRAELAPLDPLELLHQIREGQSALAALGSGDLSHGPERESLEEFLAKLPELWRAGEVRPTHRSAPSSPRSWRTRKDPFEEVWPEILLWLQADPDSTAKSLMERLQREYPGRFPDGQLRTLQRRVGEWRHVMAKTLAGLCLDSTEAQEKAIVVGAEGEA